MPAIDLTWNLFLTAIAIPLLGWFLKRMIDKSDKLQEERHSGIVDAIHENRELVMNKLDAHCEIQEKLHKNIDERFWRHSHQGLPPETGNVVIRGDAKSI